MRIETNLETYHNLKKCLSEIYPQIEVKLISQDPMLKALGFVDYVPCEVELCGTEEQFDELREITLQFEIDAFNGKDPRDDDPDYILYLKYGWIFNFI